MEGRYWRPFLMSKKRSSTAPAKKSSRTTSSARRKRPAQIDWSRVMIDGTVRADCATAGSIRRGRTGQAQVVRRGEVMSTEGDRIVVAFPRAGKKTVKPEFLKP
jgi:hypothetical protein